MFMATLGKRTKEMGEMRTSPAFTVFLMMPPDGYFLGRSMVYSAYYFGMAMWRDEGYLSPCVWEIRTEFRVQELPYIMSYWHCFRTKNRRREWMEVDVPLNT
jgi:hypothetical protein